MWKKVDSYALYWAAAERTGTVHLSLADGSRGSIKHLSKEELAALGDILRNEQPVWYHSFRGDLSTERQPMDEEDRN